MALIKYSALPLCSGVPHPSLYSNINTCKAIFPVYFIQPPRSGFAPPWAERELVAGPDLLANVRFEGRTGVDAFQVGASSQTALGSGFYGLQGNITAVKTSDPVVFFGNLSYTENLPAKHLTASSDPTDPNATTVGHYRTGAAVGFQVGTVLAINPETSMTWGWDQRFTQVTSLNGNGHSGVVPGGRDAADGCLLSICQGSNGRFRLRGRTDSDTPNLEFSFGLPFRTELWNRRRAVTKQVR